MVFQAHVMKGKEEELQEAAPIVAVLEEEKT